MEALGAVDGVGASRLKRFGAELLKLVKAHKEVTDA